MLKMVDMSITEKKIIFSLPFLSFNGKFLNVTHLLSSDIIFLRSKHVESVDCFYFLPIPD